jgi:hypothetical protein
VNKSRLSSKLGPHCQLQQFSLPWKTETQALIYGEKTSIYTHTVMHTYASKISIESTKHWAHTVRSPMTGTLHGLPWQPSQVSLEGGGKSRRAGEQWIGREEHQHEMFLSSWRVPEKPHSLLLTSIKLYTQHSSLL